MILQALVEYYDALAAKGKISKVGWAPVKISYALNIDKRGRLLNIITLLDKKQQGKKEVETSAVIQLPEAEKRSSGIKAQFLWDNAKYMLGIDKDKPDRAEDCFRAMREKCKEVLAEAHGETAEALKAFYDNWQPEQANENEILKPYLEKLLGSANITFYVEDELAVYDNEVRHFWEQFKNTSQDDLMISRCLVTGKLAPIARLHPNIKGVPNTKPSGASLVAFNAAAYESYGHEQGYNAPVSEYAAFAYTTILNRLVKSETNHLQLGETTILFWSEGADEENEDIFEDIFSEAHEIIKDEDLKNFFEHVKKGDRFNFNAFDIKPDNKFYILGLSPNSARVSIRFFLVNTFGEFLKNFARYYEEFEIVHPAYDSKEQVPLWQVLQETANKKSKDKSATPLLNGAMLRSILSGDKYPEALYQNILLRVKADRDDADKKISKVSRIKAAAIKAYLLRNKKEVITVSLNEESKKIPYVLGRVFAVLEHLQESANPGINSTIKDRYFNSACATPGMTFPLLLKLANNHLRKLSDKKGLVVSFEKKIGELMNMLTIANKALPSRLSLEEQGEFILGYYHQKQKRYEKKEEN